MKSHTVKQGDCISSISEENGFFWETVWNHPRNKELKKKRKDPNVLFPGDVVFVPDIRIKEVTKATDQVHKFRVKNTPAKLELRFLKDAEPRKGEKYVLMIDGEESGRGEISSDGKIHVVIPPTAKSGKLFIGEGEQQETYNLVLGYLDPVDTISGVKARLKNIGFECGKINDEMNDETREAIEDFQGFINHPNPSGEIDDQTREVLERLHEESSS